MLCSQENHFLNSRRYGVSVNELRELNDLNTNKLAVGTRLIISQSFYSSSGADSKESLITTTGSELNPDNYNDDGVYINPNLNYDRPAFDIPRMNKGVDQKTYYTSGSESSRLLGHC